MPTTVSILIVNWNTREALGRCLVAVQAAPLAAGAQVIVVDNGSIDGSVAMLQSRFASVEVLANDRNLGFGAANNLALARAKGDLVLFLNPDTELTNGALEAMLSCLDRHPAVAVVGTTLRNPDGSLQPSCHSFYSFFSSLIHNRVVDRLTDRWTLSAAQRHAVESDVDWMVGACLLARRSVLEVVHGFDPDYFLYGEEIDLQYRIRSLGWRVVYVPSAGLVHHGSQSARQAPLASALHNYRGRWLFVRKHYPWWAAWAYLVKTVCALLVWLGYWALQSRGAEARRQCRDYLRVLAWHVGNRGALPAPRPGR